MTQAAAFETTQWSMVVAAPGSPGALERLLKAYWRPIYVFIRGSGHSRDQAADLTQEFVSQVMLERGLIERADRSRGRFRTFLKAALRNFLVDQHRRATSAARRPEGVVLQLADLDRVEPDCPDPATAFDRQWAATLLSAALERVEADCAACGQQGHWRAFQMVVLEPALRHITPPPLSGIAGSTGAADAEQVSSMIQTVRRKFRRTFRDLVASTVADSPETELEYRELKGMLGL